MLKFIQNLKLEEFEERNIGKIMADKKKEVEHKLGTKL